MIIKLQELKDIVTQLESLSGHDPHKEIDLSVHRDNQGTSWATLEMVKGARFVEFTLWETNKEVSNERVAV